jgi:hypothetical protein
MTTTITAALVRSALENAGMDVQSYSGRGMFGRTCVGVIVGRDRTDEVKIGLAIALEIANTTDDPMDIADKIEELVDEMPTASSDSMGHDSIIYWPSLPWDESED